MSLDMRGIRSPMIRTAHIDPRQQKASPAAILPYLNGGSGAAGQPAAVMAVLPLTGIVLSLTFVLQWKR